MNMLGDHGRGTLVANSELSAAVNYRVDTAAGHDGLIRGRLRLAEPRYADGTAALLKAACLPKARLQLGSGRDVSIIVTELKLSNPAASETEFVVVPE